MALGRKSINLELPLNMTPMIDCVFQLIIFFIVVIDMSQKELEDLKLPVAKAAKPDKQEERRPILNVDYEGRIYVMRALIFDPKSEDPALKDPKTLENWLAIKAAGMPKKYDEQAKKPLPDDFLLIRADKNTPFKHVQKIMEMCGKEGILIWKLQLAAAEYKPDEQR